MTPQLQVAIVGAGPAGLLLSHLLHRQGIDSHVLESRSCEYVEQRVRAGVLEQGTVDTLCEAGVGERLLREGMKHDGVQLQFAGQRHRIELAQLTGGRTITVYGQQEVVKDLIRARLDAGGRIDFDAEVVRLDDVQGDAPRIHYREGGQERTLTADFVIGCDGFHGVCRQAIPEGHGRSLQREYPHAWLGILAQAPPSSSELVYVHHERGFALLSQRSPTLSRLYIQVDPHERVQDWPDDRLWEELARRVGDVGGALVPGPILEKGITAMRSFVYEPMRFGRLFLAGDAAHIVPPTGAKGMNLAVADVRRLSAALRDWYRDGSREALDGYSELCLQHVWKAQEFSAWMTQAFHRVPDQSAYDANLQIARLHRLCTSRAAAAAFAESYVG